ncbi:hypothetical protein EMIT0P291_280066 [Pseudomonas sp. IT-P291]
MIDYLSAEQLQGHDVQAVPAMDIDGQSLSSTQRQSASNIHPTGN